MGTAWVSGRRIAALALLIMAISVSAIIISESSDDASAEMIVDKNIIYETTSDTTLKVIGLNDESVSSVYIPDSITHVSSAGTAARTCYVVDIADNAFDNTSGRFNNLKSVRLPDNLNYIGEKAFYKCTSLSSITLPASTSGIEKYAFSQTGIESLVILGDMEAIPFHAFSGCSKLTSVELPSTIKTIGNYAFSGCKLLSNFTMPSKISSIGDYAFQNCSSLSSIGLPNTLIGLGEGVFAGCTSISSIVMPDVTAVPDMMFEGCASLTDVKLSPKMTSIGMSAFSGCTKLVNINLDITVKQIGATAFAGCLSLNIIEITTSVEYIGGGAFENCPQLTYITLPNTVKTYGSAIFGSTVFYDLNGNVISNQKDLFGHSFERSSDGMKMVSGCNYTVSYDVNGGSIAEPDEKVSYGSSFIITEYEGVKTGYVFAGWSCEGKEYRIGDTYTMPGHSVQFTIIWDVYVPPSDDKGIINEETIKFIVWAAVSVLFGLIILGFSLYIIYHRRH